jgi:hypothetical protein
MSIEPLFAPDLDITTIVAVRDMAPAFIDYLRTIRARQHALMSGWGGPARCASVNLLTSIDYTWTVPISVPPGVTEMDFALLAYGAGTITLTCSADATGTQLIVVAPVDGGTVDAESATWIGTGGPLSASLGAASGRAVTVRATNAWTWIDVDLTVAATSVADRLGILAIETHPVHRSR